MKKQSKKKRTPELKKTSEENPKLAGQPTTDPEVLKQIELGREIMKEYREVFEKLAKT